MATDQRDTLWDKSFVTYNDCYFEEIVSERLVYRWGILDDVTKVLVALTASGSVISGWALWNTPEFKFIWIILAGIGAFLSIVHAVLNVQSKVKEWENLKKDFTSLRIKIETFRHLMEINPQFEMNEFLIQYEDHRNKFSDIMKRIGGDITRTSGFEEKTQNDLNLKLEDQTQRGE
ncbi:MAG: hypothetical protein COB30_005325 [Ectothiorhodospiraceae bacterium]|nr:hypothetical protein [Ectothiorhodospiraceae bacterium]